MKTLEQIRDEAIEQGLEEEITLLSEFIREGKTLDAWQYVLGQFLMLYNNGIISHPDLEWICPLAEYRGKEYCESGEYEEFVFKITIENDPERRKQMVIWGYDEKKQGVFYCEMPYPLNKIQ